MEVLEPIVGTTKADFMNGLPGIYSGIPFADYTTCDAVNASKLKELAKSPLHLKHLLGGASKDSKQLALGRLIHSRLLEPDTFEETYAIEPKIDKRTKEGKELHAMFLLENAGKIAITAEDRMIAEGLYDSVMQHPEAGKMFEYAGENELSIITIDPITGLRRKIRIDRHMVWDGRLSVLDFKSTRDASPENFPNEVRKYQYHMQGAYYLDSAAVAHEMNYEDFIIIAGETKPPYAIGLYRLDATAIAKGHSLWRKYLNDYHQCITTDVWPGYTPTIHELTLPGWATYIEEEEEDDTN